MLVRLSTLVITYVLLFSTAAFAATLKNEDSKRYELKLESGASTTSTSIEGNTTSASICSKCKINIEGVGSIEVAGSDEVVIKGGKVSKK